MEGLVFEWKGKSSRMGILSSLYTGVSGLAGQGEVLAIYGDNIANASTVGFKSSRPEFHDMVFRSLSGFTGGNQIGCGMKVAAVNPIFSQGTLVPTDSTTDLAITGNGFFPVKGSDGEMFTRNGSFHFDKQGRLISSDNYQLMGFQIDEKTGKMTSKLGPIELDRAVVDAKPTANVTLQMNLDLRSEKVAQFDPKRPDETSSFSNSVTVYDSSGTAHVVTVYFNKSEDGKWAWHAMVKGEEWSNTKEAMVEGATGILEFDGNGKLQSQTITKSSFNFNKGAKPGQYVKFDFGTETSKGGSGNQVTQYGTQSEVYKSFQDGFTAGSVSGLSITQEGVLVGHYSNGENINIAQIALAKFENPEGLTKVGQNKFRKSIMSGEANVGTPLTGGRGKILAKTIESSTTDIASEFINLMQAQRNFQANGRVIMTADELMQEIMRLKA